MSFGLFSSGGPQTRCEFVRMKGPQGKGHAEMAVTKPKGSGVETPTSEPGFCATDMWDSEWEEDCDEYYNYRHQRRLSDPSANLNNFSRYGWRTKNANDSSYGGTKARSENEGLDCLANEVSEIEAGDLRDELDDGAYNPLWTTKGFTQTFHFWKENRRQQSTPLNAFLTYVTLPWWSIAKDLLDHREQPILTF